MLKKNLRFRENLRPSKLLNRVDEGIPSLLPENLSPHTSSSPPRVLHVTNYIYDDLVLYYSIEFARYKEMEHRIGCLVKLKCLVQKENLRGKCTNYIYYYFTAM